MTNYVKAKIDKTQQNNKCSDGDEMKSNHINERMQQISTKRVQNKKYDWVGKTIHWELCKKFKFDHTNKWNMHNPESVLKNETHKVLWDFEIQTNHLTSARRPDLVIVNKNENLPTSGLWSSGRQQSKK